MVEEETRRYRPTKDYLETKLPALNINAFETPLMKIELERVVSRLLMDNLSMKRNLNDVVDFLSVFMNNHGFKRIADKILSYLCEVQNSDCLHCFLHLCHIFISLQLSCFHLT